MIRWMVEIGRVDIATEVSLLPSFLAYPRFGQLLAVLHVMAYLKLKHNSRLIFDPTYPDIDLTMFPKRYWDEFYGDVSKAIPDNMPSPLRKMLTSECGSTVTTQEKNGHDGLGPVSLFISIWPA